MSKKVAEGATEKKCFHKNGKVSTLETWDKDNRFGSIKGYNAEGKELFFHDLRSVGGHASATLEYFPNGQLSKIYFSDAPDGGIQFYNSTTKFDEKGAQTEFDETKYPFELEAIVQEPAKEEIKKEEVKEVPKQEVAKCAAIYSTVYQIQNSTDLRLRISIKTLPNNVVMGTEKELIVEPHQTINFDTILMADQFISTRIYQPEVLKIGTKPKKNKKVTVFEPGPIDSDRIRNCYWVIVRKEEAVKMNSSRGW